MLSFRYLPHFIRRSDYSTGCTNFVKILKPGREEYDQRRKDPGDPVLR